MNRHLYLVPLYLGINGYLKPDIFRYFFLLTNEFIIKLNLNKIKFINVLSRLEINKFSFFVNFKKIPENVRFQGSVKFHFNSFRFISIHLKNCVL